MHFITGCYSKKTYVDPAIIQIEMKKVDGSDGISKAEAKLIAQDYIIRNPPPNRELDISKPRVFLQKWRRNGKEGKEYVVQFTETYKGKSSLLYPFYWRVEIDSQTGEIKKSRLGSYK